MNNNQNIDISKLMNILSKMDKKQLEEGLSKVSQVLNSKDKNKIIDEITKNSK
ncbi:unknown [Clostridium sp. CAG:571]|nr:unknown [Clostridium sp. CAG:571]